MKCSRCHNSEDKVLETRDLANGAIIRRRRACLSCGHRFTSYERIDENPLIVVKKNHVRQVFDREKLRQSIELAIRKRPVPVETVISLLDSIEEMAQTHAGSQHEIASSFLGTILLEKLQKIDIVAYLRFLSVYKNFESVEQFIQEISHITQNTSTQTNNQQQET